jgi:hypothetical protein
MSTTTPLAEAELAALLDPAQLADAGFALRVVEDGPRGGSERGVVITSLHDVPTTPRLPSRAGEAAAVAVRPRSGSVSSMVTLLTPSGAHVRRFGNVLLYSGRLFDIPMKEVYLSASIKASAAPLDNWPLPNDVTERVLCLLDERALMRMAGRRFR